MRNSDNKFVKMISADVEMTWMDWLIDIVIALGAIGFGIVQLTLSSSLFVPDQFTRMMLGIDHMSPRPNEVLATVVLCAPLILRRRFPWPCLALTLILWMVFDISFRTPAFSMVPVLVALFTLAYEKGEVDTLIAGAASLVAIAATQFLSHTNNLNTLLLFQNSCMVLAVAFAGNALNARQGKMAALEAQAKEVEHAQEAESQKRVEEERVRIARELHDITAHSISAIGIQAAVAERMIGKDDVAAADAVSQIRSISKDALGDMRAMVRVLRGASSAETSPIQGTSSIMELASYLDGFDIECQIDEDGYAEEQVPSHIDVALYKIAREGVTNIARHSGAEYAKISLGMQKSLDGQRFALLRISDDGTGISGERLSTGGHGLSGMRERAQVLGGSMKVINHANDFELGDARPEFEGHGTTIEIRIPVDEREVR